MSKIDDQIIEKITNLGISKSDAESIVEAMNPIDKSRALTDLAFLQDICKTPPAVPAPIPIPYPEVAMAADTKDGAKKVKIEDKDTILEDKSSFEPSIGDEAGTSSPGRIGNINGARVLAEAKKLLNLVKGLEPIAHQLLVISLAIGLASGYGVGLIPYNNMKKDSLTRISALEDTISGQESLLIDSQNNILELQTQLDEMRDEVGRRNEDLVILNDTIVDMSGIMGSLEEENILQNTTISNLQNSLANAETQIQIYINEIRVDTENDRIIVAIKNPSSFHSVITGLIMYTSKVVYRDTSEDATGMILGGETVELVWTEQDASAPSDYIDDDSDYLIFATTITGYSDWHMYRAVKMRISVQQWRIRTNQITIYIRNENLAVPFPIVDVIGVSKIEDEGPSVFYNITDPIMIQEGTLGGGNFMWNETAALAPEGFLRLDSEYTVRVTYGQSEQWLTYDKYYSQKIVQSPSYDRDTPDYEEEW